MYRTVSSLKHLIVRTVMSNRIDTRSGRLKLLSRREPYWHKLAMSEYLGYRKLKDGSGRWIARKTENRQYIYESLNCDGQVSFSDAQKMARLFFDQTNGLINYKYTVQDAIDEYVAHLSIENSMRSSVECKQRLSKHIPLRLARLQVSKLTSKHVRDFRDGMISQSLTDYEKVRKSKDSANRVMNMLKAALNLAFRNDMVNSDVAWKRVRSFHGVGKSRELFITDTQAEELIEASSGGFRDLLLLGLNTGARYGELRKAKVRDFDSLNKTLTLSGKTGERLVYLSQQSTDILLRITKPRLPEAYILSKDGGDAWGEKDHSRLFRAAVLKSKLPKEAVFYSLRHYYISKALLARVPVQVIAENCGTSVRMIEQHYGKFMADDRRVMLDMVDIISVGR